MRFYTAPTRPPQRVKVRKDNVCGICHKAILKGEYADFFSWCSYSGYRKEWHCVKCVEASNESKG